MQVVTLFIPHFTDMSTPELNKEIVRRFNKEVIEQGNEATFHELMDAAFINQTAPPGANRAADMWHTFSDILRPAFPDLNVEIHDQIAEDDKVTTRKSITGTHTGELVLQYASEKLSIPPTNKKVKVDVIDIVRLQNGKYTEHWGLNTLHSVLADLRKESMQ